MDLSPILHDRLFNDFITLFVVINPIGTIPLRRNPRRTYGTTTTIVGKATLRSCGCRDAALFAENLPSPRRYGEKLPVRGKEQERLEGLLEALTRRVL